MAAVPIADTVATATRPRTRSATDRPVAIYCDGADLSAMLAAYRAGTVQGFTTNPTLMAKAGICDYSNFAREVLSAIRDLPISFEVFADDFAEMGRQAREIASWGGNVFVKIPVTNTRGDPATQLIHELSIEGLQLNVTAVMTIEQVTRVYKALADDTPAIISVFAGRIADTGRDPCPMMREAVRICSRKPEIKILWASPREVLSVYQAEECGCHIITVTPDIVAKLPLRNKDLDDFSRETVQMFFDDAQRAGFRL